MRCKYTNDDLELEVEGKTYTVDVAATADYTYDPGCMYMPNGDPGYPPEAEFELDDFEAIWYDEKGVEVEPTDSMLRALRGYLEDHMDEFEYD